MDLDDLDKFVEEEEGQLASVIVEPTDDDDLRQSINKKIYLEMMRDQARGDGPSHERSQGQFSGVKWVVS